MFEMHQEPAFRAIKEEMDRRIRRLRRPPLGPEPPAAEPDIPGLIERLSELRDAGIITKGEFEAKKADLLARI